jgi:hypothetical protein
LRLCSSNPKFQIWNFKFQITDNAIKKADQLEVPTSAWSAHFSTSLFSPAYASIFAV